MNDIRSFEEWWEEFGRGNDPWEAARSAFRNGRKAAFQYVINYAYSQGGPVLDCEWTTTGEVVKHIEEKLNEL